MNSELNGGKLISHLHWSRVELAAPFFRKDGAVKLVSKHVSIFNLLFASAMQFALPGLNVKKDFDIASYTEDIKG